MNIRLNAHTQIKVKDALRATVNRILLFCSYFFSQKNTVQAFVNSLLSS